MASLHPYLMSEKISVPILAIALDCLSGGVSVVALVAFESYGRWLVAPAFIVIFSGGFLVQVGTHRSRWRFMRP
jgi:hypothetical protein